MHQLFVDCAPTYCGWKCNERCYCERPDIVSNYKLSGVCPKPEGCAERWVGKNDKCNKGNTTTRLELVLKIHVNNLHIQMVLLI